MDTFGIGSPGATPGAAQDRSRPPSEARPRQDSAPAASTDTLDLTARAQVEGTRGQRDWTSDPAGAGQPDATPPRPGGITGPAAALTAADEVRDQILAQPAQATRAQANGDTATILAMLA
jgi:hypothetical protein